MVQQGSGGEEARLTKEKDRNGIVRSTGTHSPGTVSRACWPAALSLSLRRPGFLRIKLFSPVVDTGLIMVGGRQ
jgi:hypothetical protein